MMNLVKIKDFPNYSINEEGEIYSNHSGKLRLITPYKNHSLLTYFDTFAILIYLFTICQPPHNIFKTFLFLIIHIL